MNVINDEHERTMESSFDFDHCFEGKLTRNLLSTQERSDDATFKLENTIESRDW